jgi:broad specificity phosphatase PhoE
MGRLILVRHGKTLLNSLDDSERLRGWMDIPLDEQGLREAQETAQHVGQHSVQHIYCSDLYRAKQTADALIRATQAPIVYTSDLRPWNLGSLTGQRVADILPTLLQLEVDLEMPAPGGGESFLSFYERYSRKLMEMLEIAERSSSCIVAVTHHRNLLAAPTILENGDKTKIPVRGGARTGDLLWVERKDDRWTSRIERPPVPVTLNPVVHNSLVQPADAPLGKPSPAPEN